MNHAPEAEVIEKVNFLMRYNGVSYAQIPLSDGRWVVIGTLDDILRLIKLQVVDDSQ